MNQPITRIIRGIPGENTLLMVYQQWQMRSKLYVNLHRCPLSNDIMDLQRANGGASSLNQSLSLKKVATDAVGIVCE